MLLTLLLLVREGLIVPSLQLSIERSDHTVRYASHQFQLLRVYYIDFRVFAGESNDCTA